MKTAWKQQKSTFMQTGIRPGVDFMARRINLSFNGNWNARWPTRQQIALVGPTFRPRCIFVLCWLIYAILRSKKWVLVPDSCSEKCFEILGRCNLRINRQQGIYDNGRALPQIYRDRVLDLYHQGFSSKRYFRNYTSLCWLRKQSCTYNYEDNLTTRLFLRRKNSTPKYVV